MQTTVQLTYGRRSILVTPTTAGVPAAQKGTDTSVTPSTQPVPSGAGLYQNCDFLNPQLSADAGVPRLVKLTPFAKDANTTWTLVVYGMQLVGSIWRPIMLYSGSCVCDGAITGDTETDLDNNDKYCSAITSTAGVYAPEAISATGAPASVIVNTRGCPFLILTASDAAGRVAVAPVG